jgi:hypothetical protein
VLLDTVAPLDRVLEKHAVELGEDFTAYRNHCYRVLNLCAAQSPGDSLQSGDALEKFALAAAFHDLGIWTAHTFDYLAPSAALACDHLACTGRGAGEEITAMIHEHHRITSYRGTGAGAGLVETFRRADWVDVSLGVLSFGLPRARLRAIFARWPNAGFHRRLAQLTWQRFRRHPLSPIPVLKW